MRCSPILLLVLAGFMGALGATPSVSDTAPGPGPAARNKPLYRRPFWMQPVASRRPEAVASAGALWRRSTQSMTLMAAQSPMDGSRDTSRDVYSYEEYASASRSAIYGPRAFPSQYKSNEPSYESRDVPDGDYDDRRDDKVSNKLKVDEDEDEDDEEVGIAELELQSRQIELRTRPRHRSLRPLSDDRQEDNDDDDYDDDDDDVDEEAEEEEDEEEEAQDEQFEADDNDGNSAAALGATNHVSRREAPWESESQQQPEQRLADKSSSSQYANETSIADPARRRVVRSLQPQPKQKQKQQQQQPRRGQKQKRQRQQQRQLQQQQQHRQQEQPRREQQRQHQHQRPRNRTESAREQRRRCRNRNCRGRNWCPDMDVGNRAYLAPTVFEGKARSMSSLRKPGSNYAVTFEVKQVYKSQPGFLPLQKNDSVRLHFRDKTGKSTICTDNGAVAAAAAAAAVAAATGSGAGGAGATGGAGGAGESGQRAVAAGGYYQQQQQQQHEKRHRDDNNNHNNNDINNVMMMNSASTSGVVRANIKRGKVYLVFVNRVGPRNFTILGEPVIRSKRNEQAVQAVIRPDYVREVTLSELRDSVARYRDRVKLVCRTRGSPPPRVHWLKDGVPLQPRRGLRIQHKRRRSKVVISSARPEDSGRYECVAESTSGHRASLAAQLLVARDTRIPETTTAAWLRQEQPCPIAGDFCMNGGTCLFFETVGEPACRCAEGFTGLRCENKDVISTGNMVDRFSSFNEDPELARF